MDTREGKQLHDAIDFVGLRAHATAVGLIQLTAELVRAGVLGESAVERMKESIAQDLVLNRPPHATREAFEKQIRMRLDRLFAAEDKPKPLASEGEF